MKVILKLEEFPKYLGLPKPFNLRNIKPEGLGLAIVSICKLIIIMD